MLDIDTSFNALLRPTVDAPSTPIDEANRWDFDAAFRFAQESTRRVDVEAVRAATLYLSSDFELSSEDLQALQKAISGNHPPDPEVRSLWLRLCTPLPALDSVEVLQIKGIVFDASRAPPTYGGAGWPRELYFGGRDGQVRRYDAPKSNLVGMCLLREAVNEFLMCRLCTAQFRGHPVAVPAPVGWGEFPALAQDGRRFGFVILGLPRLVPGRERAWLDACEQTAQSGDFAPVGKLLHARSVAMRLFNSRGIAAPGRHFGNISLMEDRRLFMHDLGPPHSSIRECMDSDAQFAAESFAQLVYAVTPRKICIPVPPQGHAARRVVVEHVSECLATSLAAYYGDPAAGAAFSLADMQATFDGALRMPMAQVDTSLARYHVAKVVSWLRERRCETERASALHKHATACRRSI